MIMRLLTGFVALAFAISGTSADTIMAIPRSSSVGTVLLPVGAGKLQRGKVGPSGNLYPASVYAFEVATVADTTGRIDITAAAQAAVDALGALGGGTLHFASGRYLEATGTALALPSNVRAECDAGAQFVTTTTAAPNQDFFTNVHNTRSQFNSAAAAMPSEPPNQDQYIGVLGCQFVYPAGVQGAHAISFQNASHILVLRNRQINGQNLTAMVNDFDVDEGDNFVSGATNACFDHWGGTYDARVHDNYCYLAGGIAGSFGIQSTALSTDNSTTTPVQGLIVTGNHIFYPGSGGACVELNGPASGPTRALYNTRNIIRGNYCESNSSSTAAGIQLAGPGGYNIVEDNIIEGVTGGASIDTTTNQNTDNVVRGNILIDCAVAAPHQANIELYGPRNIVTENKFVNCTNTPYFVGDNTSIVANNDLGGGRATSTTNPQYVYAGVVQSTGGMSAGGPISAGSGVAFNRSLKLANLNAVAANTSRPLSPGSTYWCADCREVNQATGQGTGVVVTWNGGSFRNAYGGQAAN